VVVRLAPHQGRDDPLRPVYVSGYHVCPPDPEPGETFFRPAMGKGRTPTQARASALAEAIERHASLWQGDEPSLLASLAELRGEAVAPRALLNFSDRQYAERPGDPGDWRHTAPRPFHEDAVLAWTPCWSLTAGERRHLPTTFCFNHAPQPLAEQVCPFDPNGNAAGNCREEAILQGFLELVERDAVGIWWFNRLQRPGVALESFPGGYCAEVEAQYRALGWQLWVLDLTSDLEIPVMVALGLDPRSGRFVVGFGCHLDPALALERAVTEANQIFDRDPAKPALFTLADLERPAFVFPHPERDARRWADFPPVAPADLAEEVRCCIRRAQARGLETIVLDYTRPDLVLATVKVVVPGLRHFWRRLGRGRLYDVPVAMGELERPWREEDLNPLTLRA
jgi:thiazole/oxazole-forming peptide maturase SagD family component